MLSLKLIDENITDKEIKLLAKWRKKVQPLWGETFKVTFEGTKEWITNISKHPMKALFFVIKNGREIGHVGFDLIEEDYCFIGNIIRGRGKSDGSMSEAIRMLIRIARKFHIKEVNLWVVKTNKNAIRFYKKLGFKIISVARNYYSMKYYDKYYS